MQPQVAQSISDPCVFIIGRPPIAEYITFVRTMAVDGHSIEQAVLVEQWRQANARIHQIEATEAGAADSPPIMQLPQDLQLLAGEVAADPAYKACFSNVPTDIALVELDRLVVFQKYIRLGFVEALKSSFSSPPTDLEVAKLALGIGRTQPHITVNHAGQGVFQFISPSDDLRHLETQRLDVTNVLGFNSTGRPVAYIVTAIGLGTNLLSAIHVEGRLVLFNGSHRAYALRSLGVTHAPCVIQHASSREELELIASGDLQQKPDRYLTGPRPAMLRDYFDPQLTRTFSIARKNRLVQIQVSSQIADVPAT